MNLQLFSQEKTEAPTPRRRQEARGRGQVARSPEVASALLLLSLAVAFRVWGPAMADRMWRLGKAFWGSGFPEVTREGLGSLVVPAFQGYAFMLLPLFAVAMVVGTSTGVLQGGFLFTVVPLNPEFNRLNPLEGLKRILSKKALVEMAKALLKTAAVASIAYLTIRAELDTLIALAHTDLVPAVGYVGSIAFKIMTRCGFALLVVAGMDYAFQRWEHERGLMMTKQEMKEELKHLEGRPEVRAKIRERQRAIARLRMMAHVAKADVVVANPTHYAVALRYDALKMAAPRVVAKGEGHMARRIRQEAEKHGVMVVRNVPLAQGLFRAVEIGDYVPAEFYKAVAEVLAFVYRLKGRI
ncbi:MAG: flagellar biosynthesis protein FlhB [Bacillota bacterium]